MSDKTVPCPDPECNTPNAEDAEKCIKCGLTFGTFLELDRILSVRERIAAKKKAPEPAPKKRGGLASLMGGGN